MRGSHKDRPRIPLKKKTGAVNTARNRKKEKMKRFGALNNDALENLSATMPEVGQKHDEKGEQGNK